MQSDQQGREAGALILEEIDVFNQSMLYYERVVHAEVWREIIAYLGSWTASNGLAGEAEEDTYFYFYAPTWKQGDAGHAAWFEFAQEGEGESYDIADLCGVGTGRVSLRFKFEPRLFGGRKNWLTIIKRDEFASYMEQLYAAGFVSDEIGELFLPVVIPQADLAAAWRTGNWDEAFKPVQLQLAVVKANLAVFVELVDWMLLVSAPSEATDQGVAST